MRRRRLLIAWGIFVLGLVFGFVSLALGPLGLLEALIVLGLIAVGMRRFPERTGAYLIGISVLPVILLSALVVRLPACSGHGPASGACYSAVTVGALVAYVVVGIAGAVITVLVWRGGRRLIG